MPNTRPKHRLLLNYDHICPTCGKAFYSRRVNAKYCCKDCSDNKSMKEYMRAYRERKNFEAKNLNVDI